MEILQKFNQKVERLENSKFVEWTFSPRQRSQDNIALSEDWLALHGLHKDDLDGFVLNFRFLIQDRDGFSVRYLKTLYDALPSVFNEEKKEFDTIHQSLSNYLAESSFIQIKNRNFSNQDFFEIIFYGGLAHQNMDKYNDFLRLTNNGIINGIVFFSFSNVLIVYLRHFMRIKSLNQKLIAKKQTTST